MPIADRARSTLSRYVIFGFAGLLVGGVLLTVGDEVAALAGFALIAVSQVFLLTGIIGNGVRYGVAASGAFDLFISDDDED